MFQEEKVFNLRFSLEAQFSEEYDGDEDSYGWVHDWEARVKPDLIKAIFSSLRKYPAWKAHIRNRGLDSTHEIEIALVKSYSPQSE
ncbi:MAG: hypothetical protein O7F12_09870 [Nitrospirae bacterium]|nr:hypothetical protein [Nitrospirota bacterium]